MTKSGYKFTSWNTKADGSGTTYAVGDMITMGDESITLYAQWESLKGGIKVKKILDKVEGITPAIEQVSFVLHSSNAQWDKLDIYKNQISVSGNGSDLYTGYIDYENIPVGYYLLHEETTAEYYETTSDIRIYLSYDDEGNVKCYVADELGNETEITQKDGNRFVIEVVNHSSYGPEFPITGGPGLGFIKEFGWMLLLLAAAMAGIEVGFYGRRRKKA